MLFLCVIGSSSSEFDFKKSIQDVALNQCYDGLMSSDIVDQDLEGAIK
jgi:hypothetical protein